MQSGRGKDSGGKRRHRHRTLAGAAHDIAHHAASGLSCLSPHLAQALRAAGLETTTINLFDPDPYPQGAPLLTPLRLALQALSAKAEGILEGYGFARGDVASVQLSATPAPWDKSGYLLHTRAVITVAGGRSYDSGWLQ
jgi:hypothetical protein